jgi:hypothetical protein
MMGAKGMTRNFAAPTRQAIGLPRRFQEPRSSLLPILPSSQPIDTPGSYAYPLGNVTLPLFGTFSIHRVSRLKSPPAYGLY